MIYWKDILVDVERMLDAAAGAATLLQNFCAGIMWYLFMN